ncbi:MAG TPA: tetratricopeptide repeat protein [Bryobacteraceae bacterium]|jgi:predicted CXXCH cytochrome family protein
MVRQAISSLIACLLLTAGLLGAQSVDSAVCGSCHREIARNFQQTGMGRSASRPTAQNAMEDYHNHNTLEHRISGRYYTMTERDGKFYQRRSQIGFDGKETNLVEKQADFVIGSGNHARTYLHRTPDGQLTELPVSWYAENRGHWAMSPGYDRADQKDFRRPVPEDCLFCHSAKPSEPAPIDCQRCHGPGGAHVRAAGSGKASAEEIRRAIVNPGRLNRDRQLEVCMQCHLETTSRYTPNSIRRYDRTPFSYRPGEALGDYMLYFDHGKADREDRFEIAHAAYRLRKSACFRASQMTCTTCHDPHRALRGEQAVEHYKAVCRSCHATAHRAEQLASANCLECHMPKRRAEDAVHVVVTDHYIQRRKPDRDLLAPIQERVDADPGNVTLYYPERLPLTPENELYLAVAQVQDAGGLARLEQAIQKYKPQRPELYFELGEAYRKAGKNADAIRWYEEALRRRPDYSAAAKQLVAALFATGQTAYATRLLERSPADAITLTNLGNAYLQQSKLDQAERALRQALQLDPESPEAQNLLGLARLERGDTKSAEICFREAIRIVPELAAAHNNLANLLAGNKKYPEAQYHFEKAIQSDPLYAAAHHGYGLLLILMSSYDRAASELREAVRLNPDSAEAHTDLADLLAAQGHAESAREEYARAEAAKRKKQPH